jgi:hypothetical protein
MQRVFSFFHKTFILFIFLPEGLLSSRARDARMVENRGLFSLLLLLLLLLLFLRRMFILYVDPTQERI